MGERGKGVEGGGGGRGRSEGKESKRPSSWGLAVRSIFVTL